jgi:hypothetical protein
MNKIIKFGLAFLLIGLAIVLAVTVTGNSQVLGFNDDENFTAYEDSFSADQFESIDFDFDNRRVYILESEDDQVHISFYIHEKDEYTYNNDDDELQLTITRKWYYNLFSMDIFTNRDFYKVYLYLPSGNTINAIDVESSNGRIELVTDHTYQSVRLSTSNGDIDMMNFSANRVDANTSNGDVVAESLNILTLLNLDTSNGKILMENIVAEEIEANTSNGKIDAQSIDSSDISLDTSNGRVYLSVIGDKDDYRVSLSTSNGDKVYDGLEVESNIINQSGTKSIYLDSSNGDVEVVFLD